MPQDAPIYIQLLVPFFIHILSSIKTCDADYNRIHVETRSSFLFLLLFISFRKTELLSKISRLRQNSCSRLIFPAMKGMYANELHLLLIYERALAVYL